MDFANMTREQLLALLAEKTKKGKPTRECFCGCGGMTQSKFVPGHDARFHSWARKLVKGELTPDAVMALLPHEEARDEMERAVEHLTPKVAEEARKRAEKAAEKAAEAAANLRR